MPPPRHRVRLCWVLFTVNLIFLPVLVHPFSRPMCSCQSAGGHERSLLLHEQVQQECKSDSGMSGKSNVHMVSRRVVHSCNICSQSFFDSRNDLFRHIRAVHQDYNSNRAARASQKQLVPTQIALLLAYYNTGTSDRTAIPTMSATSSLSLLAGDQIRNGCLWTLNNTDGASMMDFVGMTQASVARQRHMSLSQETNCAAAGDVIIVNFKSYSNEYIQPSFINTLNTFVQQQQGSQKLHIVSAVKIPSTDLASLHAEQSCTQLVYHYLLPLWWLFMGQSNNSSIDEIRTWWDNMEKGGDEAKHAQHHPPAAVIRIKKVLKSIRSNHITETSQSDNHKNAYNKKRFGTLARFERKPFHNFADPSLKGNASPNHDPVWRTLDQVKIVDFISSNDNHDLVAVVEFRGDGFLKEQIRRLVGTLVAVLNGWIPENFFDTATRPDVVLLETPLAPDNHSYLSSARFHYYELVSNHGLFSYKKHQPQPHFLFPPSHVSDITSTGNKNCYDGKQNLNLELKQKEWLSCVQQALLKLSDTRGERGWLINLRDIVAPRIMDFVENMYIRQTEHRTVSYEDDSSKSFLHAMKNNISDVPSVYHNTLTLLRIIYSTGKWPVTSTARSRVISPGITSSTTVSSGAKQRSDLGGSFTVINSKLVNENGKINSPPLPHSNFLFPDLVTSVFELERRLSTHITTDKVRPPSTHCAINCNAQFLPHVDSGRGMGQKLSMIVGLGNYLGGELYVEGVPFDIKYKPMEFDGWKLRHWTAAFEGERFSLVWFTPELSS